MGSEAVDPISYPQAWDTVTVAGVTWSGLAEVSQFKRANEWDVKKGKGTVGATVTYVGRPPAKGSIKFLFWTVAHFQAWATFRPLFKYDPTKKTTQAVELYHPSLSDLDLAAVVAESISNIVHEGEGMYSATVELLEYFPPPKQSAVSTPSNASQNAGGSVDASGKSTGTQPPNAQDAQQQQIAQLLAQAQAP